MQHIDMDSADLSDIHLQIRRACHDLNAPLRAVHGFADIINQREAEHVSERGQLYLQRMLGATIHMEQVVEGLHQYARLATHSLQLEPLAITCFSQKFISACYHRAIANGKLHHHQGTSLQWVSDRELLQIIIRALVDNALLFSAPETVVNVSLTWQVNADQLQLSVQDNGIGIALGHQQRIFNLFERLHTREQYPGTGTGLTLAWKATQILQGSISLHSAPDQGTCIEISLPRLPALPFTQKSCHRAIAHGSDQGAVRR